MRRTLKCLVAAAVVLPTAAHAQACTSSQLASNPLVSMGYVAMVRINNTAFDLSCYYQDLGGGQIGFASVPSVTLKVLTHKATATIAQAVFTTGSNPVLNYGVSTNMGREAMTPDDFIFAFAAPLTSSVYDGANAQIGVTRASGSPNVSVIPTGAPSTLPLGGSVPSFLVAHTNFIGVHGGGAAGNPFASNLGVDVGGSACSTGTACSYPTASSDPNATLGAWGTIISYRETRTGTLPANAQVNGQVSLSAVPEPATLTLMAAGLLSLAGVGYARRRMA